MREMSLKSHSLGRRTNVEMPQMLANVTAANAATQALNATRPPTVLYGFMGGGMCTTNNADVAEAMTKQTHAAAKQMRTALKGRDI